MQGFIFGAHLVGLLLLAPEYVSGQERDHYPEFNRREHVIQLMETQKMLPELLETLKLCSLRSIKLKFGSHHEFEYPLQYDEAASLFMALYQRLREQKLENELEQLKKFLRDLQNHHEERNYPPAEEKKPQPSFLNKTLNKTINLFLKKKSKIDENFSIQTASEDWLPHIGNTQDVTRSSQSCHNLHPPRTSENQDEDNWSQTASQGSENPGDITSSSEESDAETADSIFSEDEQIEGSKESSEYDQPSMKTECDDETRCLLKQPTQSMSPITITPDEETDDIALTEALCLGLLFEAISMEESIKPRAVQDPIPETNFQSNPLHNSAMITMPDIPASEKILGLKVTDVPNTVQRKPLTATQKIGVKKIELPHAKQTIKQPVVKQSIRTASLPQPSGTPKTKIQLKSASAKNPTETQSPFTYIPKDALERAYLDMAKKINATHPHS